MLMLLKEDLINKNNADLWHELTSKQQDEIKLGLQELDAGKRVAYSTVLKKSPNNESFSI